MNFFFSLHFKSNSIHSDKYDGTVVHAYDENFALM